MSVHVHFVPDSLMIYPILFILRYIKTYFIVLLSAGPVGALTCWWTFERKTILRKTQLSGPDFITIHSTVVETFQSEPQCWTDQHFHVQSQAGSMSKTTQTTLTPCLHRKLRETSSRTPSGLSVCSRAHLQDQSDQIRFSRDLTRKPLKTKQKLQTESTSLVTADRTRTLINQSPADRS